MYTCVYKTYKQTRRYLILFFYFSFTFIFFTGAQSEQSLTRFAAFSTGCEVFELTLTRGYSEYDLREDLKVL